MASSTSSKLLHSDIVNYTLPFSHRGWTPRLTQISSTDRSLLVLILQACALFLLFKCTFDIAKALFRCVMATLSRPNNQVFINFRGKDIRYGFVSHLTDALKRYNIEFFIDTDEQKGRNLTHLLERIRESKVALVILSIRYGESTWCLDELKTIMEQEERGDIIAIPIFYKVSPEDVNQQKGKFGHCFRKGTKKYSPQEKETWQVALKNVCNRIGFHLEYNSYEAQLIKDILKEIAK